MAKGNYHNPIKTKSSGTGGRRKRMEGKKLCYCGNPATNTKVGEKQVRGRKNARGNCVKIKLKMCHLINVRDKEGKIKRVKMKNVLETPGNPHNARQNIITKGAIVDTEAGKAKVTNRVGQDGVVNGVLV
ncbi:MAG: 30S ribosomal protein S8e [Candidatus Micrarchaeota archaeon]